MSKIIVQDKFKSPLYSLHDSRLMELEADTDSVRLIFQSGYQQTAEPYEQVDGSVEITGLAWDFCCAYVMEYTDVLCGSYGSFKGKKMTVQDFLKSYPKAAIDVMDEMYGYNQVRLSGFLNHGGRCDEIQLEFYYTGEFRYRLDTQAADLITTIL